MFLVNFFHLTAWQAKLSETKSETSQSRVQVQQRHVEATTEKFHQQVKNLISDPDLWGPTGGPTCQKVQEFLLVETWHGVSVNIRRKIYCTVKIYGVLTPVGWTLDLFHVSKLSFTSKTTSSLLFFFYCEILETSLDLQKLNQRQKQNIRLRCNTDGTLDWTLCVLGLQLLITYD